MRRVNDPPHTSGLDAIEATADGFDNQYGKAALETMVAAHERAARLLADRSGENVDA